MNDTKFFPTKKALITVIAASVVVIIALGIRQTFGMFYFDFATDLDITITQFGFTMGLQLLLWGVFSPMFGIITDKYGGNIAIFIGFVFYLLAILLFYSGFNTGYYFTITIGVALFVSTPKIPVGTNQNNNQTAREALKEAFSNKSYIYLTLGFFVCGWHIALVATHIPTYMIDKGLPDWCAAMVLALIGLFNMVGTITSGYLATRYSQKILLSAIYLLRGVSIIYFIFLPPSVFNSVIFGITFGMLWLSTVPPTNGIIGKVFGTKYIGLLYGIVFVSHQIGSFLGAYLSGVFYELNGNFDYAWYISIALSIFAGLIHLPIKEKPIERPQIA